MDRNWAPISGLKPEDFRVEYRGEPVQILSVDQDLGLKRVVLLLDASGSLRGSHNWKLAVRLAAHMVHANLQATEISLMTFNTTVQEEAAFSSDRNVVVRRLEQIATDPKYEAKNVRGLTSLLDAIAAARTELGDPAAGDAIYIITDGRDNASKTDPTELRHLLAASHVRLFVCLLETSLGSRNRTPEELGPSIVEDLSRRSGGVVFGPLLETSSGSLSLPGFPDPNLPMAKLLDNAYRTMREGYRVEIKLPQTVDRWTDLKLDIAKPTQNRWKQYQLGFTRDVTPCSIKSN